MRKTELKVVEDGEQGATPVQELEHAGEHTEELPPVSVAVGSFDARVAGLELCSIAHELAKHRSSMAAFYIQEEKKRREHENLPPLTYEEEEKMFEEALHKHLSKKKESYDDHLISIMRRPTRHLKWGDLNYAWTKPLCTESA